MDSATSRKSPGGTEDAHRPPVINGASAQTSHNATNHDRIEQDKPQTNGTSSSHSNGDVHGAPAAPIKEEKHGLPHDGDFPADPPPEVRHITENFHSLSTLFERVTQECFTSTCEMITKAADTSNEVNKKLIWLDWAQQQKDKFVKLLVLTQWSRRSADVSKLIDLYVWTREQDEFYDQAQYYLGLLRKSLDAAKLPRPDIETALEILSTGKSSKIPDPPGNYIPQPPLTAREQLKLLKDLNVLLHIRMNLHEDIPVHFRDFEIQNGRVTFRVENEFEVDLTLADEDHSKPLFFLDIRFLFTPFTEIPYGPLHEQLEFRINEVLASGGLLGCYNFLHEYVLTHKIGVLRRQTVDMRNTMWTGAIDVESIHRILIIRYWPHFPGPKNWIEIGVHSGKSKKPSSWRPPNPSHLTVKWFRQGKQVVDADINLDVRRLDVQRLVKQVISRHICFILGAMQSNLAKDAQFEGRTLDLATSDSEPSACALSIPVNRTRSSRLSMDAVSSRFSIGPRPSTSSKRCVDALSSSLNPTAEIVSRVHLWRASELQREIESHASDAGLSPLPNFDFRNASVVRLFGEGIIRVSVFVNAKWNMRWALVVSITARGEVWWVMRLNSVQSATNIETAKPLDVGAGFDGMRHRSKAFFSSLGYYAEIKIVEWSNCERLTALGHRFTGPFLNKHGYSCLGIDLSRSITSETSSDTADKSGRGDAKRRQQSPLVNDRVQLIYSGYDKESVEHMNEGYPALATCVAVGKLRGSAEYFELLALTQDPSIKIGGDGLLIVFLKSPLGSDKAVDGLLECLEKLQRLRDYIVILRSMAFSCEQLEFNRLKFFYDPEKQLSASLDLSNQSSAITVSFEPPSNPHNRMKPVFMRLLNNPLYTTQTKFVRFATVLKQTVGLLHALSEISTRKEGRERRPLIRLRSPSKYLLHYPFQGRTLLVQLRHAVDGPCWSIQEVITAQGAEARTPSPLAELFAQVGEGWTGLGTSIVAEDDTVGSMLKRIDDILRK